MKLKAEYKELKEFAKKLKGLDDEQVNEFITVAAKELASRLIAMAKQRTPVDTGQLRRGWTGGVDQSPTAYAFSLPVVRSGDKFIITITNPEHYASYVEFGHRTVNGGWVEPRYMLTRSEVELEEDLPRLLENMLNTFIGRYFK